MQADGSVPSALFGQADRRFLAVAIEVVDFEPASGGERYALATSINLSVDGIGVRADEELRSGLQLAIAIHEPEMSFHGRAVVRHCAETDTGSYIVGLEFVYAQT